MLHLSLNSHSVADWLLMQLQVAIDGDTEGFMLTMNGVPLRNYLGDPSAYVDLGVPGPKGAATHSFIEVKCGYKGTRSVQVGLNSISNKQRNVMACPVKGLSIVRCSCQTIASHCSQQCWHADGWTACMLDVHARRAFQLHDMFGRRNPQSHYLLELYLKLNLIVLLVHAQKITLVFSSTCDTNIQQNITLEVGCMQPCPVIEWTVPTTVDQPTIINQENYNPDVRNRSRIVKVSLALACTLHAGSNHCLRWTLKWR